MLIRVRNLLDTTAQYTFLSAPGTAGTVSLNVKNINGFATSWGIQIGKTAEEKSEVCILGTGAVSGSSLTLATATVYDHPTDTPIYATKYDKIIWKRSTTGTSGTATAFATSVITPDSQFSQYDDTSGASTYAYKACYYNSVLGTSATDSDWITPSGYSFYSLAKIRDRVKNKLLNSGFIGTDDVIDDWINEYLEMMTNAAIDVNEDYNMGSTSITFSANQELGTIGTADFKSLRRVWMASNEGTFQMTKMEMTQDQPNQIYNETYPMFFMYGDNIIARRPKESLGTMSILYYKLNPVLSNETDEIPTSMKGYTKGFIDYCLSQAYYKDNKFEEGHSKEADAASIIEKYKKELVPRNKTGPTMIDIVENFTDDNRDYWFRV